MAANPGDYTTLVELFELRVPLDEFQPLVSELMARLEREGVSGLVSMQFYATDVPGELGAVIRFTDRSQFLKHIEMISGFAEFRRFTSQMKLLEIRIFGELDSAVEAWMRQFDGPIRKFEHFVAGFVRAA